MSEIGAVAFTGMPAAGKSRIGELVAAFCGRKFFDTDRCIEKRFNGEQLASIVDRLPPEEFAAIEEAVAIEVINGLRGPAIIATGGSMIYHEKAMRILRRKTHIVYLRATVETILERVPDPLARGVVLGPGETLVDVYKRRAPFYKKYAHRIVDTDTDRPMVAAKLARLLHEEGLI